MLAVPAYFTDAERHSMLDAEPPRHTRLRAIEDQIEQAREAVAMAQGSMTPRYSGRKTAA